LTTWLEEHLSFQGKDGSLNDWIASGGAVELSAGSAQSERDLSNTQRRDHISADKNTTEADQETSARRRRLSNFSD